PSARKPSSSWPWPPCCPPLRWPSPCSRSTRSSSGSSRWCCSPRPPLGHWSMRPRSNGPWPYPSRTMPPPTGMLSYLSPTTTVSVRPAAGLLLLLLLAGACTVGPDYKRPNVNVPATFRGQEPGTAAPGSMGDLTWWTVFEDETLQQLIRIALKENYDLNIAAARVLESRAALVAT